MMQIMPGSQTSKECPQCGVEFEQVRRGGKPQRFCSTPCRLLWASKHRWDSYEPKVAPCVSCGKTTASRSGVAVCDDDECRKVRAMQRRRLAATGVIATPIDYFKCRNCGVLFIGKQRSNRMYCTQACAARAGKRNGKHRRRTAERSGDFITINELGERDGWKCHICGQVIRLRSGAAGMSPSIDHLIPIAAGGPHVWANVAIAHKRCNSRRHTGGFAQLRLN